MALTIPELFEAAVAEVPDKPWLLYEDEAFTYAQARERIGRAAARPGRARRGPGRPRAGDRAQPPGVPVHLARGDVPGRDPRGRRPALHRGRAAGLVGPGRRRAGGGRRRASAGLFTPTPAPTARRARPGAPRRPGRADPDVGHHRAVQARDADAPRLRDGRRGLPVLDGADGRRPADDVAAAVPHQRARVLGARLAGARRRAWCCCPASRPARSSTRPAGTARPSSTRSARCSRSSCASRSAPTTPTTRCASATPGPSPTEERQLEIEQRFGLRIVCGYAMSETPYGLIWRARHPAVRHARLGPPAPDARPRQRGPRGARRPRRSPPARSASCSCATRRSCAATGRCPRRRPRAARRTAGCAPATSCATTATARYTFVGREKEVIRRRGENLAPAEVEEALESHPDVLEAAVVGVPSELSEEEVKAFVVVRDRRQPSCPAIRGVGRRAPHALQGPALLEAVDELPHTPTGRVAKHRLDARADRRRDRLRGGRAMTDESWLRTGIGASDADSITLMGRDLARELMGQVTFTELAFLLVQRRMPSAEETRLLDAVLVSLADHGLTPTCSPRGSPTPARPSRSRARSPPACSAAGSVFLGVVEDTARFLDEILAAPGRRLRGRPARRRRARGRRARRRRPAHPRPRAPGAQGPGPAHAAHLRDRRGDGPARAPPAPAARRRRRAPRADGRRAADQRRRRRRAPRSPTSASRAELLRGFALLARTAGLLGHLAEEMEQPLGMPLYREIDERARYEPPD